MSIERLFNKLDEKLSSLVRSLGLIITILFGFIFLIFNYFKFNLLIFLILILIIMINTVSIIYCLFIYIYDSSKKDEEIYRLNSFIQLKEINSSFYKLFVDLLEPLANFYSNLKFNSNLINFVESIEKDLVKGIFKVERKDEYILEFDYIVNFIFILDLFCTKIMDINKFILNEVEVQNRELLKEKSKEFLNLSEDYITIISKYKNLELLIRKKIPILSEKNIYYGLKELIKRFSTLIEQSFIIINEKIYKLKKKFERKIRISYTEFGISTILSIFLIMCLILLIFLI